MSSLYAVTCQFHEYMRLRRLTRIAFAGFESFTWNSTCPVLPNKPPEVWKRGGAKSCSCHPSATVLAFAASTGFGAARSKTRAITNNRATHPPQAVRMMRRYFIAALRRSLTWLVDCLRLYPHLRYRWAVTVGMSLLPHPKLSSVKGLHVKALRPRRYLSGGLVWFPDTTRHFLSTSCSIGGPRTPLQPHFSATKVERRGIVTYVP